MGIGWGIVSIEESFGLERFVDEWVVFVMVSYFVFFENREEFCFVMGMVV